jgi:hypothetical protein
MEPRLAGNAGAVLPLPPVWQKPGFMAHIRRFAEPRLMMTAAMAFFSIALTLNLTGVRLSSVKLSDLRPAAVRSYMERRITTASTPIVRYYDHLRLVYEVQTRMREFQRSNEGSDQGGGNKQNNSAPSAPGESHRNPAGKDGGSRTDPPQESVSPNLKNSDMLETSLTLPTGHAHSGGSALVLRERSTSWIA